MKSIFFQYLFEIISYLLYKLNDYSEYLGYTVTIEGTAKNTSSRNYSYVQIEFVVYDVNGNNLGTALANINNLGSGDTWSFEAMLLSFPSTRPGSYKLVEITAY